MSKIFILDACALLAVVRNEEGANIVSEAYIKAANEDAQILILSYNLKIKEI